MRGPRSLPVQTHAMLRTTTLRPRVLGPRLRRRVCFVGRLTPNYNHLGGVLNPTSTDSRIQRFWDGQKERELTLSMVAMKSNAADVMWKMMMKARSTNIFTGHGGARSSSV